MISSGACAPALGESLQEIKRGRIGPMQVLERERDGLRARPGEKPPDKGRQLPPAQFLWREFRDALLWQWNVDQAGASNGAYSVGSRPIRPRVFLRDRRDRFGDRQAHPRQSAGDPIRRSDAKGVFCRSCDDDKFDKGVWRLTGERRAKLLHQTRLGRCRVRRHSG